MDQVQPEIHQEAEGEIIHRHQSQKNDLEKG
jgi:hypothetical protein